METGIIEGGGYFDSLVAGSEFSISAYPYAAIADVSNGDIIDFALRALRGSDLKLEDFAPSHEIFIEDDGSTTHKTTYPEHRNLNGNGAAASFHNDLSNSFNIKRRVDFEYDGTAILKVDMNFSDDHILTHLKALLPRMRQTFHQEENNQKLKKVKQGDVKPSFMSKFTDYRIFALYDIDLIFNIIKKEKVTHEQYVELLYPDYPETDAQKFKDTVKPFYENVASYQFLMELEAYLHTQKQK